MRSGAERFRTPKIRGFLGDFFSLEVRMKGQDLGSVGCRPNILYIHNLCTLIQNSGILLCWCGFLATNLKDIQEFWAGEPGADR